MKFISRKILILLFSVLVLAALVSPAFAQAVQPPPTTGAWSEVIGPDGNINYSNLTDGGIITQQANWMPTIPFTNTPVEASYHVYYTPSGNEVVMPTASTLFFMATNPNESGFNAAASTLGTSGTGAGENLPTGIAGVGAVIGALLGNSGSTALMSAINQAGYTGPSAAQTYFQDVISGQQSIWSLNPAGLTNFLSSLWSQSSSDHALYTYMLLYAPDQCATTPGGCSAAQLALLATPVPTSPPPPTKCPGPSVKLGAISAGGQKMYPNYPLVVGQDPAKTGVTLALHASVAPTIYTYYTQESTESCEPGAINGVYSCWTGGAGGHKVNSGYTCIQHTQSYTECIASASGSISLSQASRDWILTTLSLHFPKAYIHNPYFSVGGSGCAWQGSGDALQIDDPGIWNISVSGRTSGTPVSGPRSFTRSGTDFSVALKEIAIVK